MSEKTDNSRSSFNPFIEIFVETSKNEIINLQDIINCLKETIRSLDSILDPTSFDFLSAYINDYSFSSKLFSKLENILNIFFDQS